MLYNGLKKFEDQVITYLLKKIFFEWRVGFAIACVAQNDLWQYMILKS